ncbi:MAG: ABC transporter ATP-binding protein [Clostridiales bacterium]|jgi:spermidine/putrescine transport system ATP-binding protein|nr:ABC transporter ATP-binding protein [Clostridiales bacterium]
MSEREHLIDLVNVDKVFGQTTVLNNINLYIRRNEFLTLLGPSGCGKTTTLRIIGGFEYPTKGDLIFEGKSILKLPPYRRHVNTVFQKYALFPNMNVTENIAFGLKIKKLSGSVIAEKVEAMLKLVNLSGYGKRSVTSLSGGQQQRVAIARALVNEPRVLLLDEPLGALDLKLRKGMQIELKHMQRKLGITFIYVTHDQEEALTMSDTVAVMNAGEVQQIGAPEDIYNEPRNAFVANFIGESNILDGCMRGDYCVEFANKPFKCVDKGFLDNEPVDVVIRPEDIKIVPASPQILCGTVRNATFKGVHYEMLIEGAGCLWKAHSTVMSEIGRKVGMVIAPDLIHVMHKSEYSVHNEADRVEETSGDVFMRPGRGVYAARALN